MIQNDNNAYLEMHVRIDGQRINITGCRVTAKFRCGEREFTKEFIHKEPLMGICYTMLTTEELASSGMYDIQGCIEYDDGTVLRGRKLSFLVAEKI